MTADHKPLTDQCVYPDCVETATHGRICEQHYQAMLPGLLAAKEGRVRPWKDVERELFGEASDEAPDR